MIELLKQFEKGDFMNEIEIRKVEDFNGFDFIIYPTSYINPLLKKSKLNESLKIKINKKSNLLFDLLLCNGDCYNRFCKVEFDGYKIIKSTLDVIELDCKKDIEYVEEFYREDKKLLTKGVITTKEYMLHC